MLHCSEQALREPDFCKSEVSTSTEACFAFWHSVIERVMGGCNLDGAGIPCGNFDFHFTDRTFPQSPGRLGL